MQRIEKKDLHAPSVTPEPINLLRVPVEGGAIEEVLPVESSTFTMIADVDAVYAFILNEGVYRIPDAP